MEDRELGLTLDDVTGQKGLPCVGGRQDSKDGGSEPCRPVQARVVDRPPHPGRLSPELRETFSRSGSSPSAAGPTERWGLLDA
jgi:hypothetical protein